MAMMLSFELRGAGGDAKPACCAGGAPKRSTGPGGAPPKRSGAGAAGGAPPKRSGAGAAAGRGAGASKERRSSALFGFASKSERRMASLTASSSGMPFSSGGAGAWPGTPPFRGSAGSVAPPLRVVNAHFSYLSRRNRVRRWFVVVPAAERRAS